MHGYGDQVEPTQEGSTERIKQESLATKAYTQRGLVVKAEGSQSRGRGFKTWHRLKRTKQLTLSRGFLPQHVKVDGRRRGAAGPDISGHLEQASDLMHLALASLGTTLGQPEIKLLCKTCLTFWGRHR